ncbi:uncharacterized protein LOC119336988 isoform X2 [Triticum dicoccoides]|uniref:uncharacterized protein LOC119336988 isoform X2 n=1 Tax=Triticum dicoccoides TaxID=85692 RepID=UPI001891E4A8|nr:uncharacterized protein LOC119336988 isoform X2 [Triticum dicoccoides]
MAEAFDMYRQSVIGVALIETLDEMCLIQCMCAGRRLQGGRRGRLQLHPQGPEWGVGEAAGRQICVKATIERYKKANSDTSNSRKVAEVNAQFAMLGDPGVLYGEAKQQPTTRPVTPDEGTTTHHDYPLERLASLHPAIWTEKGGGIIHTVELVEP